MEFRRTAACSSQAPDAVCKGCCMTHRLSSSVGSHDHGFTLRPLSSTVTGRSLSMQDSRKHEREIPARQRFERAGKAQHFGRVGVGHRGDSVVDAGSSIFFVCGG